MNNVVAIIPAAGSGKRMQQSVNKQFLEIGGLTIIERTLRAFEKSSRVNEIIVVTKSTEIDSVKAVIKSANLCKVRCVVEGGAERQDSIYNGLKMTLNEDRWVLVHDGARPFIMGRPGRGWPWKMHGSCGNGSSPIAFNWAATK